MSRRNPPTLNPALTSAPGRSEKFTPNCLLSLIQQSLVAIKSAAIPPQNRGTCCARPLWHGSLRLGMWRMLRTTTKKPAAKQYAFRACSGLVTIATRPVVQHGDGQLEEISGAEVMSGAAVVQTAQRICSFGDRPNRPLAHPPESGDKLLFTTASPDLLKVPH